MSGPLISEEEASEVRAGVLRLVRRFASSKSGAPEELAAALDGVADALDATADAIRDLVEELDARARGAVASPDTPL